MIKIKIFKPLIIILLLIITYQTLNYSLDVINSVKFALDIWENNIFPSIFPFFIISSLLINYGFLDTAKIIDPLMCLFGINNNICFVFIMSIISGFPSSSKFIKDLVSKKIIDEDIASKALLFTHFSNPLFILGTVKMLFNKNIAIYILLMHYITNIIIGIIFKNYHNSYEKTKTKLGNNNYNFGDVLTNSIKEAIETLLLILGSISVCSIFLTILLSTIHLDNISNAIISGLIEITQGLKYISLLDISIKLKTCISIAILSFGGLSIHIQVKSILNGTKIKYRMYLLGRIIHLIISFILSYLLFDIFF